MQRYKLKRSVDSTKLANMWEYCVDSELKDDIHYIVDGEYMAIVRSNDLILWELSETPAAAKTFIDPIKREILGIYEDVDELKGFKYGEVGKENTRIRPKRAENGRKKVRGVRCTAQA